MFLTVLQHRNSWSKPCYWTNISFHWAFVYTGRVTTTGYSFHHRPRSVRRGDIVGFLVSQQFKVNLPSIPEYFSFESICVEISDSSFSAYFDCIYHPPEQPANFFEELQDLLENVATMHSELFCCW